MRISARSGLAALHLVVFSRHAGSSTAKVRLSVAPGRILQAAAPGCTKQAPRKKVTGRRRLAAAIFWPVPGCYCSMPSVPAVWEDSGAHLPGVLSFTDVDF